MSQRGRKVAFSNKQKKMQLMQKRERKRHEQSSSYDDFTAYPSDQSDVASAIPAKSDVTLNKQELASSNPRNKNRYTLVFNRETDDQVKKGKELSSLPVHPISEEAKEVTFTDFIPNHEKLGMPKRPSWNYDLSKKQLQEREQRYFENFLSNIEQQYGKDALNFDLNLENWRQLWRVIEMSDIVLLIVDVRYPLHLFSPALFNYVTNDLKKHMILILNKVDLVPASLVVAWKEYMMSCFPGLRVVYFASYSYAVAGSQKQGCRRRVHMSVESSLELLKQCEEIVNDRVSLSSWKEKIEEEASKQKLIQSDAVDDESDRYDEGKDDDVDENVHEKQTDLKIDTSQYRQDPYSDGVLTLGCVGHPNVGKSAFLNAVVGRKVVSVSKTPGHTKHFQTIFLTQNVKLCDCPGLVFPNFHPRGLQAIIGSFPIANLRDPFSSVRIFFERVPVHQIMKLEHPQNTDEECDVTKFEWSTYDLCSALAFKKGFLTAKASRPDMFRAAKYLLRLSLDGQKMYMCFYPSQYVAQKDKWNSHEDISKVKKLQHSVFVSKTQQEKILSGDKHQPAGDLPENHTEEKDSERESSNSDSDTHEESIPCAHENRFTFLSSP